MASIRVPMVLVLLIFSVLLPSAQAADGEVLYKRLCTSCHGYEGEGRRGLGPALQGSPMVSGEIGQLIEVVANGRDDTLMVAFRKNMQVAELAAVITYVRRQFGGDVDALVRAQDLH